MSGVWRVASVGMLFGLIIVCTLLTGLSFRFMALALDTGWARGWAVAVVLQDTESCHGTSVSQQLVVSRVKMQC